MNLDLVLAKDSKINQYYVNKNKRLLLVVDKNDLGYAKVKSILTKQLIELNPNYELFKASKEDIKLLKKQRL